MNAPTDTRIDSPRDADISFEELAGLLRDSAVTIVDVLPRESYLESHIEGAVSLPVAEIEGKARQVIPDLGRAIVVYCGSFT